MILDKGVFDSLSKNKDLERNLQQVSQNSSQDPVVREMAEMVIQECQKAEKRSNKRKIRIMIAFVVGILLSCITYGVKHHR